MGQCGVTVMAEETENISTPERDLLNFIKDNWTLENEGVTIQELVFTDKDAATDNQVYAPTVCVQQAGARRKQAAENSLYDFTFIVKTSLWSRWSKIPTDTDKRLLHWLMVDHIKRMFDPDAEHPCGRHPAGWEYAYVESTANVALAMNLLPDLNEFNITVKAVIPWQ
jgi:hypothetical protein